MLSTLRARLTYANVVSSLCLFIVLGGSAYAATKIPKNSVGARQIKTGGVKGKEIATNAVTTRKVKNRSLLARDFKAGQLPSGARGPAGAAGATNVRIRTSGEGTAGSGAQASGANGGNGGDATCNEAGCLVAKGGAGGDGSGGGAGGNGGNSLCTAGCDATGGNGGAGAGGPDPGEGAVVGLRASCLPGERAVGGGARTSSRDGVVHRSQPATTTSANPSAGQTPNAWYVEAYNQSRAGEGRTGVDVTVRAYVVCAAP